MRESPLRTKAVKAFLADERLMVEWVRLCSAFEARMSLFSDYAFPEEAIFEIARYKAYEALAKHTEEEERALSRRDEC